MQDKPKDSLPQMQFCIQFAEIAPNNDDNTFGDYNKLVIIHARRVTDENAKAPRGATQYLLFGDHSESEGGYFKTVTKEEAEKEMVNTFLVNAKRENVFIPE